MKAKVNNSFRLLDELINTYQKDQYQRQSKYDASTPLA